MSAPANLRFTYGWDVARRDLVTGATVAAIAIPQAMAYALIAGVDPRFGLYSAIVVTIIASILGSSNHLINVVGKIPAALPLFHIPEINWHWISKLFGSAVAISFLGLLEALAVAKSIATYTRQSLDYNRQCLAEGISPADFSSHCLGPVRSPAHRSITSPALRLVSPGSTRA